MLLADDQPLLCRGFRMIVEAEDDLTATGEAADGDEAIARARTVISPRTRYPPN